MVGTTTWIRFSGNSFGSLISKMIILFWLLLVELSGGRDPNKICEIFLANLTEIQPLIAEIHVQQIIVDPNFDEQMQFSFF